VTSARTIGLLGGMSWESSSLYYQLINEEVRQRLGGTHSAALILYSFDFADIEALQRAGAWGEAAARLARAAAVIERAGADVLVLCTNTMHRLAEQIQAAVSIPLLHIVDAVAEAIRADGHRTVGLLGTKYTMEADFYRRKLRRDHGLDVVTPQAPDRERVHDIIYRELVRGIVRSESRDEYARVIDRLQSEGATAVILGCTEIELLVPPSSRSWLYPSTALHARAAVDLALSGRP
jgi:aspartate racemase